MTDDVGSRTHVPNEEKLNQISITMNPKFLVYEVLRVKHTRSSLCIDQYRYEGIGKDEMGSIHDQLWMMELN